MKLLFYFSYSGSMFEHNHSDQVDANTFPTSTNANEHVLLALGSDHTGMDNVE